MLKINKKTGQHTELVAFVNKLMCENITECEVNLTNNKKYIQKQVQLAAEWLLLLFHSHNTLSSLCPLARIEHTPLSTTLPAVGIDSRVGKGESGLRVGRRREGAIEREGRRWSERETRKKEIEREGEEEEEVGETLECARDREEKERVVRYRNCGVFV